MINNILVIKLRAIGDAVISTPVIRNLKEYFKGTVNVITTEKGASVLRYNSNVDRLVVYKKNNILSLLKTFRFLKRNKFDLVVNLHASYHSALLAKYTGAKNIIVHNHSGKNYFSTIEITAKKEPKSAIERDLDAIRALGINPTNIHTEVFLSESDEEFAKSLISKMGTSNFICINPGAKRKTKRWDITKFAEVAKWIYDNYAMAVVIISGQGEEDIGDKLKKIIYINENIYHIKEENILKVAALIKHSRLFIGNDSGTHHIAAAFDIPSITIFGPELPREWHPYNSKKHISVSKKVHCVNCGLKKCKIMECMNIISAMEVKESVKELLNGEKNKF